MGYKIKVGEPVEIIQQGGEREMAVPFKYPCLFPEPMSCSP